MPGLAESFLPKVSGSSPGKLNVIRLEGRKNVMQVRRRVTQLLE